MKNNNSIIKKWIKGWFDCLPLTDEQYVKSMYFYKLQRLLKLNPPKTFNEKLHWLNLSGYLEKYTSLVDKYAVREYVSSRIGSQYLNELYGVYNNEAEIDFGVLPHKFILKATHGSNWNIFCEDKNKLDLEATKIQLREWLNIDFYRRYRERIYKNIPPRIICERFLEDEDHNDLIDYKFFCFHGRVQFIDVLFDRSTDMSEIFYDRDWIICPFVTDTPNNPVNMEKPENFDKMKEIAEILAEGIPFVRIDLYNVNTKIFFGEMTFTPSGGYEKFHPYECDYKLGTYLNLPVNR